MARTESLSILSTQGGQELLKEVYGKMLTNLQKNLLSSKLKNKNIMGTPEAGSYEIKRFENRTSQTYGTARTAGAGGNVTADPITLNINVHKELVTEVNKRDVATYGVDNFLSTQANIDKKSMERELERAFFSTAGTAASEFSPTTTAIQDVVEEVIQAIETTSNDFVDGVERDMISLVMTPSAYGRLRTYLDTTLSANVGTDKEGFAEYHGVKIASSVYLPAGIEILAMADGSVAQMTESELVDSSKIPLSREIPFGLFYDYGTKAVMDDLILKVTSLPSA